MFLFVLWHNLLEVLRGGWMVEELIYDSKDERFNSF